MKAPKPRLLTTHRLTVLAMTSVTILLSSFAGQAKDHVDLQFWDMIWGGPEYIEAGKALVAQFNQEHPDITVTYQAVQLYDQGAILPIDDVISQWKADGKLDDFLPNMIDTLFFCGMRTG